MTPEGFRSTHDAPRDGSEVMLLVRHPNYPRERPDQRERWQAEVRGSWTPHNGGGWTWFGLSGDVIGWRPIGPSDPVTLEGEYSHA